MKSRKLCRILLLALAAATLLFIWSNSLKSMEQSQEQSHELLDTLAPIIESVTGMEVDAEDDRLLRKAAHVFEFAILGLELSLLTRERLRLRAQGVVNCLFAGLLTAVVDESIQLISQRGSQLQDVLLDFAALSLSVCLVWAVRRIRQGRRLRAYN